MWGSLEFVAAQVLWITISRPEWAGFPPGVWWPSVAPDRPLFELVAVVLAVLYVPSALSFSVIVVLRQRRGAPLDRYSIAPVIVAIAVAAMAAGISWASYGRTTLAVALVLMPLPVAFIYSATRLTRLRVRLGEMLHPSSESAAGRGAEGPGSAVTVALRTVLRDPGLTVSFWSPERQEWVDEIGQPGRPTPAADDRVDIPVVRRDGRLSAVVSTAAASPAARREVEAAVRLCGTAIENAGLRALVRAQIETVGRAHARTLQVGIAERRRLEQDLHDGAHRNLSGDSSSNLIRRPRTSPMMLTCCAESVTRGP